MKGDLSLFVLQLLQLGIDTAYDISDCVIQDSKSNWYSRMQGRRIKLPERPAFIKNKINELELKQQFNCLLSKLKNQGLVAKSENKRWQILQAGIDKIRYLEIRKKKQYPVKNGNELKIVAFDIPERQAAKRKWLRGILKNLKFTMIQKSVWMGKSILPEELIQDLRTNGLMQYLEIFAISKGGTLKQIN